MKTLATLIVAVAASMVLPMAAQGQNLFRTGRPDYARPDYARAQPRASQRVPNYWNRPADVVGQYANSVGQYADSVGQYADSVGQYADAVGRRPAYETRSAGLPSAQDYERMVAAWDNYRREAIRYQQRFGSADLVNSNNLGRTLPAQISSRGFGEGRSACGCPSRGQGDRYDGGRLPADQRPRLAPTVDWTPPTSSAYDRAPTKVLRPAAKSTYRGSYFDPARTASRPATDFFKSLVTAE